MDLVSDRFLLGDSDLAPGVGESNLTLIGSKEDYRVDIEKGLDSVTVDGETVSGFSSTTGDNRVEIEGGIGTIHLRFQEAAALLHTATAGHNTQQSQCLY